MTDDFSELIAKMTDNARMSLQKADMFSRKFGSDYIGTEHILLGMLAQESSLGAKFLGDENITLERAQQVLNLTPRLNIQTFAQFKTLSESAMLALKMSDSIAADFSQDYIGTEHILYSLLSMSSSRAKLLLGDMQADVGRITGELDKFFDRQGEVGSVPQEATKRSRKASNRFIRLYGVDITDRAHRGELDPVIGRGKEIERVVTILARRTKSNPVLIGEPGVGKTAIVEGLVDRIASGNVPTALLDKKIIQVDLAGMIAGTKFRGEFEERLKGLVGEVAEDPDTVLFIDEIHLLAGAGSAEGSMDAANILKPSLAKGKIRLIGATTFDEYRKYIEKDKALARRLQTVTIDEPSADTTLAILKGLRERYEQHHGVKISDEVLKEVVTMANRYIYDRFMPDKVIDVLDEAAALNQVRSNRGGSKKAKEYVDELARLSTKMDQAVGDENYEKAALIKTRIAQTEEKLKKIKAAKPKVAKELKTEDLASAISLRTGIPVNKVNGDEQKMLVNLEQHLKKYIIGQDEAIGQVAKAVRRGRSGIAHSGRPIGSFVFMGPTGVGKTELARVLAREVFGGDDSLIKIDMSEFGEKHTVSRLVGAPAGYVGYDDGGKLTEAIRHRPYSVVLFDEIEKAHPEVFGILLQILEDGVLTDGQGNKIKFNNTIVILTSNIGAEGMLRESELGFGAKTKSDAKRLQAEHKRNDGEARRLLTKHMRPELVNRFDSVVTFNALTSADIGKIFDGLVGDLKQRLVAKGLGLVVKPSAKKLLVGEGFDAKNGARPLRRVIEYRLEHLVAEAVLKDELPKGSVVTVAASKNLLKLSVDDE
ncbi:MAG: ATP-dependent Clp protease ATP-binding subunit [Candidatus Nomurabacteria bacterium]|jgi:ATP-dependent Clp protease ATP-binding subunit ClpC|nr:ATP-dependent Clp protease ATP-binding subunit [Candidatus Nomurabacteria bacterium]